MLCPEVWKFSPSPSATRHEWAGDDRDVRKLVNSQYFNHFVSLTLPDTLRLHEPIHEALSNDSEFYHVRNLHAYELVKCEFVRLFAGKGQLTLISVGTKLDQDDCMVVTPTAKLVFSLRRKSFQELGIEGKPSAFSNREADKYVVTIDLAQESFKPGKKNYERIMERLLERKDLCFNVILFWEPHETEICPSSIAAYISNLGYEVKTCLVKLKQRQEYNVKVPVFDCEMDGEVMTEWLGAFSLQCNIPEKADGFVTTYEIPERHIQFGQVLHVEAVGLFTTNRMNKLIQEIERYLPGRDGSAWIALHVQGFEDAVVNRGSQEHFFYSSGDYSYTIFFRHVGLPMMSIHTSSTRRPNTSTKAKRKRRK